MPPPLASSHCPSGRTLVVIQTLLLGSGPLSGRGANEGREVHHLCVSSNGYHSRAAAGQAQHHFHVLRVVGMDGVDEASVAIWFPVPLLFDLAHNLVDEIVAGLVHLVDHVAKVLGLWSLHARQAGAPYGGARAQFHLLHQTVANRAAFVAILLRRALGAQAPRLPTTERALLAGTYYIAITNPNPRQQQGAQLRAQL